MKRFQKGKERWDGKKGEAVKKKRVSEAGNRTPVVRVTGGNTKPLYYFGPKIARETDLLKTTRKRNITKRNQSRNAKSLSPLTSLGK